VHRAVEVQLVGQIGELDEPTGGRRGAHDPATATGGRELGGEGDECVQARAVPEPCGGDVDHDLARAERTGPGERVGDHGRGGQVGVTGRADDDLVRPRNEDDVEQRHGASRREPGRSSMTASLRD